jgi:hypothetical protein
MTSLTPSPSRISKSTTKDSASGVGHGSKGTSVGPLGNLQIQRMCKECAKNHPRIDSTDELEKEENAGSVMRKEAGPSTGNQGLSPQGKAKVNNVVQSNGQPLDTNARSALEPRFGRDFSNVRVHTDHPASDSAQEIQARAYTVGNHVVFGDGQYDPSTKAGQNLLAHELTHVVQQQRGVHLKGEIGEAGDTYEREADAVANAVTDGRATASPISISAPSPPIQRKEKEEDHESEMLPQFAARVHDHAATRLTRNIGVLDEWRSFIEQIQGLQLRAQMLIGMVKEYAAVANNRFSGPKEFETAVGTQSSGERAFETSKLDLTADYRDKVSAFFGDLNDKAFGYWTSPSIAQKLQVMSGEIKEEDLDPSKFIYADPRYHFYRDPLDRFYQGKSGGCQTCHDISFARQQTIDEFGDPMPEGNPFPEPQFLPKVTAPGLGFAGLTSRERTAIAAFMDGNPQPTESEQPDALQPAPAAQDKYREHKDFAPTTHWQLDPTKPNPYVPQAATPAAVETPTPRTDLCGELTAAKDAARIPHLELWGPASAQVAEIISHINAVLTPLGPRGYRVLGAQNFDALYSVTPDGMESVRAGILASIQKRQQDYADLKAKILAGEVPYQELCPIVDELLPTTNEFVQNIALNDIHAEQRKQRILAAVEFALIGLSFLFPPVGAIAAGVGVGMGINQIGTGIEQLRQGTQWSLGIGAGIYSHAQEAAAPDLRGQGWFNIATGTIGLGFSAFGVLGAIARAQRAAFLQEALQNGFAFGAPNGTGLIILGRGGRLALISGDTNEILAIGTIGEEGPVWTMLAEPYPMYPGAAPGGFEEAAMTPYGGAAGESFGAGPSAPAGEEITLPDGNTLIVPPKGGVPGVGMGAPPSPMQEIVLPDGNTLLVPAPAGAPPTAMVPYGPTAMVPYQGPLGVPSFMPPPGPMVSPWSTAGSMTSPLATLPQSGGFLAPQPTFMNALAPAVPPAGGIGSVEIGPVTALTPEELINSHVILPRAELMSSPASYQMEVAQELATIEQARMQGPLTREMSQRYSSLMRTYLHSYLSPLPDFLGIGVGQGYSTFAVIQVVGPDGNVLAIARGMFGEGLHAEEAALAVLDTALPATLPRGSFMQIGVDQFVCEDVCVPAITHFAEQRGLSYVDAFVPQRETLLTAGTENPALASPKTTARTALRGNSPPFQITAQRIYQGEP